MLNGRQGSRGGRERCQKGMDDIAQHYLAEAGIHTVRRAKESGATRITKATGVRIVMSLDALARKDLGSATLVVEKKVEKDKCVFTGEQKS